MTVLIAVLLLALLLGGAGFAYSTLWYIAAVVFIVWLVGFAVSGSGRRWYNW